MKKKSICLLFIATFIMLFFCSTDKVSAKNKTRFRKNNFSKKSRSLKPLTGNVCQQIFTYCNNCIKNLKFPDIVLLAKGMDYQGASPEKALRYAAFHIQVALSIVEFTNDSVQKHKFLLYAKKGLDELIKMQCPSGVFPAPDVRSKKNEMGKLQTKLVDAGLAVASNGWIVEDLGFGGFQHDLGIIARVFLKGYQVFDDKRYLNVALKAAEWLKKCPTVDNWNYNANGAHLLAELSVIKKDKWIFDLLRKKMEEGVLPFQTSTGNWADKHNSRLVYHHILLASLISTYKHWPHNDDFKKRVGIGIKKAMEYVVKNTLKKGATQSWQATINYVEVDSIFKIPDKVKNAIKIHLSKIISKEHVMHLLAAINYYKHICN